MLLQDSKVVNYRRVVVVMAAVIVTCWTSNSAQADDSAAVDSLRKEVARLGQLVESGQNTAEESEKESHSGWADRMRLHGYGETHFNFPKTGAMSDRADDVADFHRLVLGWEYEFTEKIRFDAEVDFEHNASEIELEEAQLEVDVAPTVTIKAGTIIMPVGSLNEVHEPPNFYSVERPYLHTLVIPSTWQENGIGVVGRTADGGFAYRLYVIPGLNANGFSSKKGIRGGRSKGVEALMNDLAVTGRVEYSPLMPYGYGTLRFGGSFYLGQADQNDTSFGEVNVNILTADMRYDVAGFHFSGEAVVVNLDGVGAVSSAVGETVAERMFGWNAEAGYHLFRILAPNRKDDLVAFVRREQLNTNDRVPAGFSANPAAKRDIWTTGFAYYPTGKVAIKSDIEFWEDGNGATVSRANTGFAFMF